MKRITLVTLLLCGLPVSSFAGSDTAPPDTLDTISISVHRLDTPTVIQRDDIGSSVYSLDHSQIDALATGESGSLELVLTRLPGVSVDSKASGGFHIRNEHANAQFRINGIILPDSISGFGLGMDSRSIDQLDFLRGVLPAQYGLHTAGVVDIKTRQDDAGLQGQADVSISNPGTQNTGAQLFGGTESSHAYLSASFLHTNLGIENPTSSSNALHDESHQQRIFGQWVQELTPNNSIGFIFGAYVGQYQIPNNLGQTNKFTVNATQVTTDSSALNENQSERSSFAALTWQGHWGKFEHQLSIYHENSTLHYTPDPNYGDLVFTGASGDLQRSLSQNGVQWDGVLKELNAHVLRFGGLWNGTLTANMNSVSVLHTLSDGTTQTADHTPFTIQDNSSLFGTTMGVYVSDEWHWDEHWVLNSGMRWDKVQAYTSESQLSPRVNLAWSQNADFQWHLGYAQYFTPPPQELVGNGSIALYTNTSNASEVTHSDPVLAERSRYWDTGIQLKLSPTVTATVDAYLKHSTSLLDEGQFGNALILSPFNYQTALQRGIETSLTYSGKTLSAYLNLAWARGQGQNISSGQALFGTAELSTIASQAIFLDHDQTWTGSSGLVWHQGISDWVLDVLAGSGLRKTPSGGTPNSDHLPGYAVMDIAWVGHFHRNQDWPIDARIAILNVTDRRYELRDGTGVGVGASQYGAPRTLFAGATLHF